MLEDLTAGEAAPQTVGGVRSVGPGAAKLAGRDRMIAALERLRAQQPSELPASLAAFGIQGSRSDGWKRLFMSHPPLEERIQALRARS